MGKKNKSLKQSKYNEQLINKHEDKFISCLEEQRIHYICLVTHLQLIVTCCINSTNYNFVNWLLCISFENFHIIDVNRIDLCTTILDSAFINRVGLHKNFMFKKDA